MGPELHRFNLSEQQAFDRAFPPEEVRDFEEDGINDWVGIFDALESFDFKIKPEGRNEVADMFLKHPYATQIIKKETEEGLQVYRRNITPLLKASIDIFWQASEYWTDEVKKSFNVIFSKESALSNAERDWQR
jgi:hypothetical protein